MAASFLQFQSIFQFLSECKLDLLVCPNYLEYAKLSTNLLAVFMLLFFTAMLLNPF